MRRVTAPPGAQVVDARGKYLIPGLWDMHVHPDVETAAGYQLFIASGVTDIRDAWSSVPLDTLAQWRRDILAGTRVGPPRQILAGAAIAGRLECRPANTGPWTWVVPTLMVVDGFGAAADAVKVRFSERVGSLWAGTLSHGNWLRDSLAVAVESPRSMAAVERAGLPILAGTDIRADSVDTWRRPPGLALHAELAIYVADGMTPAGALRAATLNPAKLLGATDSPGTVAQGKLADLVLLDADPLANITHRSSC